jgi:excisionase family DNA binding protein
VTNSSTSRRPIACWASCASTPCSSSAFEREPVLGRFVVEQPVATMLCNERRAVLFTTAPSRLPLVSSTIWTRVRPATVTAKGVDWDTWYLTYGGQPSPIRPDDSTGRIRPNVLLNCETMEPRSLTRTDVLSTTEVAELLGIPRSTVHDLARRGELPARRVGRRWLFLRERIAAAIAPLDDPAAWQSHRDAKSR